MPNQTAGFKCLTKRKYDVIIFIPVYFSLPMIITFFASADGSLVPEDKVFLHHTDVQSSQMSKLQKQFQPMDYKKRLWE